MKITKAEVLAISRHVVTFLGGFIAAMGAVGLINATDAASLNSSINSIANSLDGITTAIATIVGIVSAWFAAKSATPDNQVKQVQALAEAGNEQAKALIEGK